MLRRAACRRRERTLMNDPAKAIALAEKITKKAEEALDRTALEMTLMKWPAEFRAIMYGAIADLAGRRATHYEGVASADKQRGTADGGK